MAELLNCPFCGCVMAAQSNRDWHHIVGQHEDGCVFDGGDPPITVPAEEQALASAIAAWNRRTPPTQAAGGEPVAWMAFDKESGHRRLFEKREETAHWAGEDWFELRPLYAHPPAIGQEWVVVGWIHEDELPDGYPYDAMFPHSKVDGVRLFPVFAPEEK